MRREELYLTDIIEAADAIQQFLAGVQRDIFLQDELLRSAVLHKLTVNQRCLAPKSNLRSSLAPWVLPLRKRISSYKILLNQVP